MLRKKTLLYALLCVLLFVLPISCDIQKRRYLPGYFIQNKTTLPDRHYIPNSVSRSSRVVNARDTTSIAFAPLSPLWLNSIHDKSAIKKNKGSTNIPDEPIQTHAYRIGSGTPFNEGANSPERINNFDPGKIKPAENNGLSPKKSEKFTTSEPVKNTDYKKLILALLSAAAPILLLSAAGRRLKKYRDNANPVNDEEKTKEEIARIADRLDRCADRFANAKNKNIESAARKAAIATSKCTDIKKAKELEKLFHDNYLSPKQTSDLEHIKLHNLVSNDLSYGVGTLKPDVVTTTGGYYKNSAGSLSWTMGEPISETISDGSNTLTQGFQQGSYLLASVVEETGQQIMNVTVYPNPFISTLNIKNDTNAAFRVQAIDLQGNVIYTKSFESGEGQIDFSNLSDEIYLLRVFDKDGNPIKVFKIQKID